MNLRTICLFQLVSYFTFTAIVKIYIYENNIERKINRWIKIEKSTGGKCECVGHASHHIVIHGVSAILVL